ncbi:MAG: hypothetical protein ACXVKQ_21125 [Acidimicrobiia bacterium]
MSLSGVLDYMEPGAPGMHTTDTIDFEVVLSGEVTLELDDGAVVHLRPPRTARPNGSYGVPGGSHERSGGGQSLRQSVRRCAAIGLGK